MDKDDYGEIINGEHTYYEIARRLMLGTSVGIGWTDEKSTHFDIVFTLGIRKYGMFQRGIRPHNLFVSIMDYTAYGFDTSNVKEENYIQQKLKMGDSITGDKIAELINGIIKELNRGDNLCL